MKVRANKIKRGDIFKRSEQYSGTTTFKCLDTVKQSTYRKNEYTMQVEVIKTTDSSGYYGSHIGEELPLFFCVRYGRLGQVTIL